MKLCYRCRVYGRVQGVFFRASTQQQAQRLKVTGYARNLTDGSVEVLACGEQHAVRALCEWLKQGPAQAQVDLVECEVVEETPPATFATQ